MTERLAMLYDVGDRIRATCNFHNVVLTPIDPTNVSVTVEAPNADAVSYAYGTDAAVVRDAVGIFHVDIDVHVGGRWWVRWSGIGALVAADTVNFLANS